CFFLPLCPVLCSFFCLSPSLLVSLPAPILLPSVCAVLPIPGFFSASLCCSSSFFVGLCPAPSPSFCCLISSLPAASFSISVCFFLPLCPVLCSFFCLSPSLLVSLPAPILLPSVCAVLPIPGFFSASLCCSSSFFVGLCPAPSPSFCCLISSLPAASFSISVSGSLSPSSHCP
ncbi:unnamed protein product, partial [Bubo scandiacus]